MKKRKKIREIEAKMAAWYFSETADPEIGEEYCQQFVRITNSYFEADQVWKMLKKFMKDEGILTGAFTDPSGQPDRC